MKIKATLLTVSLAALLALTATAMEKEWKSLFDGKTLNGWSKKGGEATYSVVDGTIIGTTGAGKGNTFLCTEQLFGDFELEFDVKLYNPLNSGVQIRSTVKEDPKGQVKERVNGPQVEIEQAPGEAGYLYAEAAGGWMTPKDKLIRHSHFKNDEWNHYRVVAKGPNIKTWLNGVQISDLTHEDIYKTHPKGLIGLQVHNIKEGETLRYRVAWKKIRIREL